MSEAIRKYSPQLASLVTQLFGPSEVSQIEAAFTFAITHGALLELDFVRPEGESFNPRPARIVYILHHDLQCSSQTEFLAAILSTANLEALSTAKAELAHLGLSDSVALAVASLKPVDTFIANENSTALRIALASALDRIRHMHRSDSFVDHLLPTTYDDVQCWHEVASAHASPLANYFAAWLMRNARLISR